MRLSILLVCATVLAGCSSAATPAATGSPTPVPPPATSPSEAGTSTFMPDPDRKLPSRPWKLAREVTRVNRALKASISQWMSDGDPSQGRPPRAVVLQSIYQQRLYRKVSEDIAVVRKVAARVPEGLRTAVMRNGRASWELRSLVSPVKAKPSSLFDTQRPKPAGVLLRYYKAAQRRFNVDWEVLAAINYVETRFGRIKSSSYAGAQGPMQFMPATWEAYGMGGNVHDPRDAIMGAANYLKASGAPHDYKRALYAYNHADEYVFAIWSYAKQMMRDKRNYFAYYNYQVFMATTKGDVQLTGPGKDV